MVHPIATIIANLIAFLMGLLGVERPAELFNLLLYVACFIWIVKRLTRGSRRRKRKKQEEDWLYNAQKRQEIRFDNALPPLRAEAKPHKKTRKEKRNERKGLSPTGWEYDEETGEWLPPAALKKEARDRWEWDENKRIWVDKYKK